MMISGQEKIEVDVGEAEQSNGIVQLRWVAWRLCLNEEGHQDRVR